MTAAASLLHGRWRRAGGQGGRGGLGRCWCPTPASWSRSGSGKSGITSDRIHAILAAGANVILTTKGIDDMSLKYFVEAGAIAVRRVPKDDLRRGPPPPPPGHLRLSSAAHHGAGGDPAAIIAALSVAGAVPAKLGCCSVPAAACNEGVGVAARVRWGGGAGRGCAGG